MKFLTDENIASSVVHFLRKSGYDVKDIKESNLYGISDKEVLKIAFEEGRIVITHDKDFGNLLTFSREKHRGVILLRLNNQRPYNVLKVLIKVLKSSIANKLENNLCVISELQVTVHKKQ